MIGVYHKGNAIFCFLNKKNENAICQYWKVVRELSSANRNRVFETKEIIEK